ncbi:gp58-like family protein [Latilactobacillus sakei]|uniref:gp58-like family protein n=1 Tax=Latilactobacillus sakei TaxID=1599 RepID=UPI00077C2502|nr:gp58-like family protein [Latilactobacillus sakei]
MLKVSDAFNSAFAAPDRELRARVTIGKTVYDSDDLTSINYDSGAMTGEQFSIGSTYMNSAKIIFSHLVEGLKQLDEVLVELGVLKPDGTVEYVKMGTFIVDDKIQMDRNNNTTTIECMDRMTMLGGTYVSKLTYPARIKDVAIEIANMAGVKANETSFARLSENKINQPTGYTYRDAIGLIAQFQMGFALFDRDGLLDIRTLQDNSFKIDPNQYFLKGLVKNETFFKLNGISCTVVTTSKDENGNETSKTTVLQSGSSSGAQIKLANNVMTQDVLDRMYEALKFTNYYPFSLNWNGNPAVEAGDWLTVEDLQGNEFKVPNMSYTLTYNGGLTTTSKADTSVSSPATYSYGGSMSNIVNEIGGREGAEGNHIYEGTEDQKPLFPKEGDLWYKHVGPDTEEWIYKDGKWEFLTSTKTANDAADAADKASKEAEEAKKQADDAVNQANQAVADAGFAKQQVIDVDKTANQAKSDAAAAGQQAKDALTNAGTALTDAKNSLTNSNSAMVDSAQARKDSATAIKDAADSLTSAKDAINKVGNLTTSVTSQFTTVDNELKSKVNQTDYDKLKGTVTSQQTEINQNASGIKLKADKSYADTINNSVVKNTSSVGLLNDQIALTVSKTELNNTLSSYATQTWTQSQIKSTADSINLSVSKVQNNLDNMELGSINLIIRKDELVNRMIGPTGAIDPFAGSSVTKNIISVEPGKYLTLSRYDSVADNNFRFAFYDSAGAMILRSFDPADTPKVLTVPANAATFRISYPTGARVKLERGQKGTEYSAAPEDLVTDVEFAELAVKVDGITATVANKADKTQITQLSDQISLKADTTALNELKGTVDKQGSEITLNTNSIKLKADQSSVNTLKGTVDKQGSAIDVNTKAIALKANQSTVDTLTGRVSTAEGKITVQADQISQTVSKTELTSKLNGYATQAWTQSQIKSTADSINLSVSKVQSNLDNMELGSVNLIIRKDELVNRMIGPTGAIDPFAGSSVTKNIISVEPGKYLTMSRYDSAADNYFRFAFYDKSGAVVKRAANDDWSHTEEVPPKSATFRISYNTNLIVKLERGQKGTEYSAAPEDLASEVQFSQLQVTVNGIQGTVQNKADQSQITQLAGQITSVVGDVSANSSQITQMKADINLRVQKGDVVNQINISPEGILIDGKKIHITGQTSIDNAVIKDAMIADIKADKITAGTLNAANVNVINLNANNITTGTIKGANLSMNLNTGEVLFQHGRIHSASNNVDVNIDQGYLSVANGNTRVLLKNGGIQFVQPTIFDEMTNPYLSISNGGSGLAFSGARIVGRDYVVMANNANSSNIFDSPLGGAESFAGISAGYDGTSWHPTKIGGADRGIILSAGKKLSSAISWVGGSASICIGSDGSQGWNSNRIELVGEYVHSLPTYVRTASGSANVIVSPDGALVRSTSASKYKTDIIRTNIPDYGEKLLNLPTATWTDIAETKRYRDDPVNQIKPTRNFGMIAEDLADAGLEMLVVRGIDGELEGINYDRIGPALIPVIAKLKNEVELLKQKLEEKTA